MKKTLIMAAGAASLLATGLVMAGGDTTVMACPQPAAFAPNFYVAANGGAVYHGWQKVFGTIPAGLSVKGQNWGYTFGGNLGYNFTQHLGAEFGGNWMSSTKVTVTGDSSNMDYSGRWFMYGAGTLRAMVYDNFTLVGKFGVAYSHLKASGTLSAAAAALLPGATAGTSSQTGSSWAPVFGLEGQYDFGNNFYMTAQWMHVAHRINGTVTSTSALIGDEIMPKDLLTIGVGYKFKV